MGSIHDHNGSPREAGQTIVLIVFLIIGLLAFVGLAVDAGFIFARSAQFSSAVDAAALAAVVEMDPTATTLVEADTRAGQFLAANGWPTATMTLVSSSSLTDQGYPQYSLTVTWPVETFFMGVVGFDLVNVTQTATAVHVAQAELYTPTYFEGGQLRKAAQFIMGPDSCTNEGDPISSENATTAGQPNSDPLHYSEDSYLYRIKVPTRTYTATNTLRIELFDPDSHNNYDQGSIVTYTDFYAGQAGEPEVQRFCATNSISGGDFGQPCVFRIENPTTLEGFNQNPLWFVRVDENFASSCSAVTNNASGNTTTVYELYYLSDEGVETTIATYTANDVSTDLKWVSPTGFEFDISAYPIVEDARYFYLRVETTGGSSKNVWDLWAGPPSTAAALNQPYPNNNDGVVNVNDRNLWLADYPLSFPTYGVQIFALGRMPLQHFTTEDVTIPLVPLPSTLADGTIYASVFDYEGHTPFNFTIDTVSTNTFYENVSVYDENPPVPDPLATNPRQVTCGGDTDCNADWTMPQLRLGIPSTYFFGGTLYVTSANPQADAHTWATSATAGRPFLTR